MNDMELTDLLWHTPPTNLNDYGEEGWLAHDSDFLYLYTNGVWLRRALNDFEEF